jgi:HD-GYP domain-containing protein (c-di-GMP phosphodiesterase class II)
MKADRTAAIQNFVRQLNTTISAVSLYSSGHRQVRNLGASILSNLEKAMAGKEELSLVVIDGELVTDGIPLGESLHLARFAQTLTSRGIGHIKIIRGVNQSEILSMVEGLSRQNTGNEILSTANIRYGKVEVRFSRGRDDMPTNGHLYSATSPSVDSENVAKYTEICEEVRKHRKLRMAGILEIVRGFIAAVKYEADPLIALAPLRATDEYTFIHSMNICILNLAQAMPLGIEGPLLHDLGIAALLHDVGKFFVPDEILNKPGRLDEAEWKIIRRHPLMGAQYLLGTPGVPHLAVITAFEHHMKYDFTGYPEISGQWQQNLCSQMTAVSDIFDAMRTKRPYKEAMDMDMIKQRMLGLSGIDLHPALTGNLLKILRRFSEVHQDSD